MPRVASAERTRELAGGVFDEGLQQTQQPLHKLERTTFLN
jgi:hypothetical protein